MIVRFDTKAIQQAIEQQQRCTSLAPPATTDSSGGSININNTNNTTNNNNNGPSPSPVQLVGISEADKIVEETRKKARAGKLGAELATVDADEDTGNGDDSENATPVETYSAVEDKLGPEVSSGQLKGVIDIANLDLAEGQDSKGKKEGGE